MEGRERRRTIDETQSAAAKQREVACECGRPDCNAAVRVSMPTLQWARMRRLIIVRPGHQDVDDAVVEADGRLPARPAAA
jgi:hypothetical protein